ncbi:hypothetical protein [Butyrivibrio sp. INlla21]|uniref:hypothetical protein n=1 Tax=Butyrivibrio sp. INlla21 TaxID=1520811 RepID=UPI0008E064FD|nr:hypothetical protein [Butyrivibrio sp. INlla21]SFU36748.1 hypothetical protein SAMN02910342_00272 [Butyrivibrio sp. INlla21]
MIFGSKDSVLRKGYNYDAGVTVVEQKRNDGSIFTTVYIACGPIMHGNGKTFEELCKECNVEAIKDLRN